MAARIAVLLDENTSSGATRYEAHKGYFLGLREAIAELGPGVRAVAHAPDGVIEAVELDRPGFALGIQWHQELFAGTDHPGNAIFAGFVTAASAA